MLLWTSLLAPFLGPLLLVWTERAARAAAAVDGFVLVAMGALIALHVLPESFEQLGWPALVAALLGLWLPKLLHAPHPPQTGPSAAEQGVAFGAAHCDRGPRVNLVGIFAALAMVLHAAADGVGLVDAGDPLSLAVAVALHRAVEGMGLWYLLRASTAKQLRLAVLFALSVATWAGYALGAWALAREWAPLVALAQASVAGSLLHVLLWHAPPLPEGAGRGPAVPVRLQAKASAWGGLAAVALVLALSAMEAGAGHTGCAHHPAHAALPTAALLARVAALGPWTAVALAWVALCHRRMRHDHQPPWHRTHPVAAAGWRTALRGGWAGAMQPSCSCGVLPLAQNLVRHGQPLTYVAAFVAAAPALGLLAAVLSWVGLGAALTGIRILGTWTLSVATSLVLPAGALPGAWAPPRTDHAHTHCAQDGAALAPATPVAPARRWLAGLQAQLLAGLQFALGEVLDFCLPWLVAGCALSYAVDCLLRPEAVQLLQRSTLEVPVFVLLASPVYFCPAASTLVAAVLLHKGVSAGAVLACLWVASSLSPALLLVWRPKNAPGAAFWRPVGVLLGGAWAGGELVNACLPPRFWQLPRTFVSAGPLAADAGHAGAVVGLALAFGLCARALFRQGVRGAAAQLALPNRLGATSSHHCCAPSAAGVRRPLANAP